MFLSIIIPVFNSEKYLAQCLDSCLNQDLPPSDYEIICINDGSSDRSEEILMSYSNQFSNIIVVKKENEGCSVARNVGLNLARGEYVWFVDNDDLLAANILGSLEQIANGGKDSYLFPYYSFVDSDVSENGDISYDKNFNPHGPMIGNALWPQIFKRDFINKNGLSHRGKRTDRAFYGFGMDALFVFECKKRNMTSEFIFEDRPIYFYRRAQNSITTDLSLNASWARVREYILILPVIQRYYHDEKQCFGQASADTANFLMDYIRTLLDTVAQMPRNACREAKQELSRAGYYPFDQPSECTYTCREFVHSKNGMGQLHNFFRYYSIRPWGLEMSSLFYRFSGIKKQIKFVLRQNAIVSFIRKAKNKR